MPAWLLLVLEQVVPLLLAELVKAGAINEAQKLTVQAVVSSEEFIGSLHADHEYPGDPKVQPSITNISLPHNED